MTRGEDKKHERSFTRLDLTYARQEAALKDSITKFEDSIASRSMVTYLVAEDIDLENPNEGMG